MSLSYVGTCDGCGISVSKGDVTEGWAAVTFDNGNRFDYCPSCWSTMFCSLIKDAKDK